MENMFYECESLLPLHITSNLNNSNSANMNQLFLEYNKIKLNKSTLKILKRFQMIFYYQIMHYIGNFVVNLLMKLSILTLLK